MGTSPRLFTKIVISLVLVLLFNTKVSAQDDGVIDYSVIARYLKGNAPAADADVIIYADGKEFKKLKTDKNGKIKVELEYGPQYKVVFTKPGCVSSYMLLNAKIPDKKKSTISGFKQDVYFIERNNAKDVDTVRYKYPFTKWAFSNSDNGFREDLSYLKEFESGVFKVDLLAAKDKSDKEVKEKAEGDAKDKAMQTKKAADKKKREDLRAEQKKRIKITGKILTAGTKQKPVENAEVFLVNEQGKKIETSTSNELGGFVFTKINPGENYMIESGDQNEKFQRC
jgi:hypothetical protein